jgi:hypothetical protein
MNKEEIVIYQSNQLTTQIEVVIENETVWLNQIQMVVLFDTTKQNITLHINNIFKEGELQKDSAVKYSLTAATDGKNYKVKMYNLDVIISVGYRVKSLRGTQFKIWATKILKSYLLKGYVIQEKIENIERKLVEHDQKFELLLNTSLPHQEGIFYNGQIFDAYHFVSKLIKSAKNSIIIIDNYIYESVLMLLAKRNNKVKVTIYTDKIDNQLQQDIEKYNKQYSPITIKLFKKSHNRFLIIDQQNVYHIGASLKDLGKKWFAFSKMNMNPNEIIGKL